MLLCVRYNSAWFKQYSLRDPHESQRWSVVTFVGRLLDVSPCVDRMRGASSLRDYEIVLLVVTIGTGMWRCCVVMDAHVVSAIVNYTAVQNSINGWVGLVFTFFLF